VKLGRPSLPKEKKRTRLISVRVTDEEYARLEKVARSKGGRDVSKWVRRLMFDAADQWDINRDLY
jgi:hypothetical protein